MDYQKLVDEAFEASKNAYVPYSHFRVGACLLLKNGQRIYGTNIENAAYGSPLISPCGACRQVLAELMNPLTPIILGNKDYYEVTNMQTLLPRAFTGESL